MQSVIRLPQWITSEQKCDWIIDPNQQLVLFSIMLQEKRKWQTEIENKKRQLEDDRRALQHLKVSPPLPVSCFLFKGRVHSEVSKMLKPSYVLNRAARRREDAETRVRLRPHVSEL